MDELLMGDPKNLDEADQDDLKLTSLVRSFILNQADIHKCLDESSNRVAMPCAFKCWYYNPKCKFQWHCPCTFETPEHEIEAFEFEEEVKQCIKK